MMFTIGLLIFLGIILVGGLLFSRLHHGFQAGDEGLPNPPKTKIDNTVL